MRTLRFGCVELPKMQFGMLQISSDRGVQLNTENRRYYTKMNVQFLLFVIAILLLLIFWELSKINSRLKKTLVLPKDIKKDTEHKEP